MNRNLKSTLDAADDRELREAMVYIKLRLGETNMGAEPKPTEGSEKWYIALADALANWKYTPQPGWKSFRKRSVFGAFVTAAEKAERWTHEALNGRAAKLDREAFRRIMAPLVVRAAIKKYSTDVPLWNAVTYALEDLPTLVETAYPGYRASGLLHVIVHAPVMAVPVAK